MRTLTRIFLSTILAYVQVHAAGTYYWSSGSRGPAQIWTLVQNKHNFTCTSTAVTATTLACAVVVTSTTAGNLLILMGTMARSNSGVPAESTPTGEGTWTKCTTGTLPTTVTGTYDTITTACYYVLSATGGVTSISFNWGFNAGTCNVSGATCYSNIYLFEVHRSSGTATFDNSLSGNNGGMASSNFPAPNPTLTGTSDYCAQWIVTGHGANAGFDTSNDVAYANPGPSIDISNAVTAAAGALNQTSCAVNWTQSVAELPLMGAIAFK